VQDLPSLVENAQRGQATAREELVRRFQDMAVGYAYSVLGDFHHAEDVAQDAFVAALGDLTSLQIPEAFPSWFRRIIYKHCDRLLRRRQEQIVEPTLLEESATKVPGPAEQLEQAELEAWLLDALRDLPEEERMVINLFYMGDYTHQQISSFLEMPLTTVNNRLRSARRRLEQEILSVVQKSFREKAPSRDDKFVNLVGLRAAIEVSDVGRVRTLVEERPDLLNQHQGGLRPLNHAAIVGNPEVVAILLEAGADFTFEHYVARPVEQARERGHQGAVEVFERFCSREAELSPAASAYKAIEKGDLQALRNLIKDGAPFDLLAACYLGDLERARILIGESGYPTPEPRTPRPVHFVAPPPSPIVGAVQGGHLGVVSLLLEHAGGSPVDVFGEEAFSVAGIAATRAQSIEILRALLDAGLHPDAPTQHLAADDSPVTKIGEPLLFAAGEGNLEICRLLLERGASPEPKNDATSMPLERAYANGHRDIVQLLESYGAVVPMQTLAAYGGHGSLSQIRERLDHIVAAEGRLPRQGGNSMLSHCVGTGRLDVVRLILSYQPEMDPFNPLSAACGSNDPNASGDQLEIVRLLLDYGADAKSSSPAESSYGHGMTVLHYLSKGGRRLSDIRTDLAALLLNYGADIEARDYDRHATPLGWAAAEGDLEMVRFLLDHGASVMQVEGESWTTPLGWARLKGHGEIADLLLSRDADE